MVHQGTGHPSPTAEAILIVGGSARALADSATATGWAVYAADLFNDIDLRAIARHCVRVEPREYPHALLAAATGFPTAPWCYSGAIENHPDLIDCLASQRLLAGNDGAAVRRVRDPARLAMQTRAAGLLFPETHFSPSSLPRDGSWLVKPFSSASGRAIHAWTTELPHRSADGMLWQRRVVGIPHSVSFIIAPRQIQLLGLSRSLVGESWCPGGSFAYGGSVTLGPAEIPPRLEATAMTIGAMLAEQFQLVGAVGVDLVVDAEARPWIVEVNPRVTASMELHERATGISIAASHFQACGIHRHDAAPLRAGGDGRNWAKAVLHTRTSLPITRERVADWQATAAAWTQADGGRSAIADIPAPGQTIAPRSPVLTVFASGVTATAALATLRWRSHLLSTPWQSGVSRPSCAASPPPCHARSTA